MDNAAQDFQDDLDTWGTHRAEVTILDDRGNPATDLALTPDEVSVMFAALRDYHAGRINHVVREG